MHQPAPHPCVHQTQDRHLTLQPDCPAALNTPAPQPTIELPPLSSPHPLVRFLTPPSRCPLPPPPPPRGRLLGVGTFTVLKNLTNFFTITGDRVFFGKTYSLQVGSGHTLGHSFGGPDTRLASRRCVA